MNQKDFERRQMQSLASLRRIMGEKEEDIFRKGGASLKLSRLPGLRVLSVKLAEKTGAACAVWQTLTTAEMENEIASSAMKTTVIGDGAVRLVLREDTTLRSVRDLSIRPGDVMTAWIFPAEDVAEWRSSGFGDCDMPEYLGRIADARVHAEANGAQLILIHATVRDMRRWLRKNPGKRIVDALSVWLAESM